MSFLPHQNQKILVLVVFDDEVFQKQLDKIYKDAYAETDRIREDIKEIVPTYQGIQ